MYLMRLLVVISVHLFSVAAALAQPAANAAAAPATANVATATRAAEAPTIDGDVLGDPAWAKATPITASGRSSRTKGSRRRSGPKCGSSSPRTRSTSAPCCYDRDPSGIIVSDSRRDAPLDDIDSFQMIFDTYRDRQNGFVFGTNPAGIEYDGQVTNEGQGGGGARRRPDAAGGSGGGFNVNWDGAWEVRAKITEHGWTAEFAIPFRTLRYPSATGADLGRELPAQHPPAQRARLLGADSAAVQPLPRVAGRIDRRHPDAGAPQLQASRRTCSATRSRRARCRSTPRPTRRCRRRPEVQPHAEPDARRAPSTPTSRRSRSTISRSTSIASTCSSRRSGRSSSRTPASSRSATPARSICSSAAASAWATTAKSIPIIAGGRVSGKAGKFNVGLLNMQTDDFDDIVPSNNFSVVRVSRDLPNRSSVGGIFVNRHGHRRSAPATTTTTGPSRSTAGSGIGQNTSCRASSREDRHAGRGRRRSRLQPALADQPCRSSTSRSATRKSASGFNPEVGFLQPPRLPQGRRAAS